MGSSEEIESENKNMKLESQKITQRAREQYLEQVSDISEKLKQVGNDAGTKAKQVIDKVGEYINKNPQKSALIGLGAGLAVGITIALLSRRK